MMTRKSGERRGVVGKGGSRLWREGARGLNLNFKRLRRGGFILRERGDVGYKVGEGSRLWREGARGLKLPN